MPTEPQRNPLPFEPSKKRQKPRQNSHQPETAKKSEPEAQSPKKYKPTEKKSSEKVTKMPPYTKEEMAVPKVVSDRMARRMALLCGIPTALGIATFVASYVILNNGWFRLPTIAVLLVSMGFFGLGVIGLSYGVLSASWDEEIVGSKLGWQEFKVNWGRMVSAWRSTRQKNL